MSSEENVKRQEKNAGTNGGAKQGDYPGKSGTSRFGLLRLLRIIIRRGRIRGRIISLFCVRRIVNWGTHNGPQLLIGADGMKSQSFDCHGPRFKR